MIPQNYFTGLYLSGCLGNPTKRQLFGKSRNLQGVGEAGSSPGVCPPSNPAPVGLIK